MLIVVLIVMLIIVLIIVVAILVVGVIILMAIAIIIMALGMARHVGRLFYSNAFHQRVANVQNNMCSLDLDLYFGDVLLCQG